MKSVRANWATWLTPVAIVLSIASLTTAQNESNMGEGEKLQTLISERRSQLDERIENLRATQETLGENHPSAERYRKQITDAEQEIETLKQRESMLDIGDKDLRILILQLALKVDRLENEVEALRLRTPRRSGGFQSLGRGRGPR